MAESTQIQAVIDYFTALNQIPRPSKQEAKVAQWLLQWAKERSFETQQDKAGNLVVRVPERKVSAKQGTPPTIVLQAHMDMVCVSQEEKGHDCKKDPITVLRKGDWLQADGTSLGADNGIAIALIQSLVDDTELAHPPLELLFTVDEESGMTGAKNLDAALLSGSKFINLDSESEGVFTVGSAGGANSHLRLPILSEASGTVSGGEGAHAFRLMVSGLRGGHSGIHIERPHGNAIHTIARLLSVLKDARIASINGGEASNALSRAANAEILIPERAVEAEKRRLRECAAALREELKRVEPELKIQWQALDQHPKRVFPQDAARTAVDLLLALPHGVQRYGYAGKKHFLESSCNLATVETKPDAMLVTVNQRTARNVLLEADRSSIGAIARLCGARVKVDGEYPAWDPNYEAELLQRAEGLYREQRGKRPKTETVHAGLETGFIAQKVPDAEIISLGPTIQHPHSPSERVSVQSVDRLRSFLAALLGSYAADPEGGR
jgi:dipeptidase D